MVSDTEKIFGLLGPNGVGKSTTIKILNTLIRPDSGKALISGFDVVRHADRVGIMNNGSLVSVSTPEELKAGANAGLEEVFIRITGERIPA